MKNSTHINTHHLRCDDDNDKRHASNNMFKTWHVIFIFLFILVGLCYFMFIDDKDPISDTGDNTKGLPVHSTTTNLKTESLLFDSKDVSNRMITNIILDKPIERPSETLYLTAFLFNGVSMMPQSMPSKHEYIQLQIIDAKDIPIVDEPQSVEVKNSILGLQYKLPSDLLQIHYPLIENS